MINQKYERGFQEQLRRLRLIENRNTLEFYQGLRNILQNMYRFNINYLSRVVEEFLSEILKNGVFYMDVINETLIYFIRVDFGLRQFSNLQMNLFLLIIEKLTSISTKQTLELLTIVEKYLTYHKSEFLPQLERYVKIINEHLDQVQSLLSDYTLHSYKDIIKKW